MRKELPVAKISAAPGNPGFLQEQVTCYNAISATDLDGQMALITQLQPELVLIGPEAPLIKGLADRVRLLNIPVYGPSASAARIEGSKAFSARYMQKCYVPSPDFEIFENADAAMQYAAVHESETYVIKADGDAAGKGVVLPHSREEAQETVQNFMVKRTLGDAGKVIVMQERVFGEEFSLMILTDGWTTVASEVMQDHKRLLDDDKGPNTGGMGVVGRIRTINPLAARGYGELIIRQMAADGIPFIGTMFLGCMQTQDGLKILEINCRFGDAETEALMPLVHRGLSISMFAAAKGPEQGMPLSECRLAWRSEDFTAAVVLAAAGYPDKPRKGDVISGLDAKVPESWVFHMGTEFNESGQLVTNGGRVLAVVGRGKSLTSAISTAYERADQISFAGMQRREDIGVGLLRALRLGRI